MLVELIASAKIQSDPLLRPKFYMGGRRLSLRFVMTRANPQRGMSGKCEIIIFLKLGQATPPFLSLAIQLALLVALPQAAL